MSRGDGAPREVAEAEVEEKSVDLSEHGEQLDTSAALARVGGDEELLKEIAEIFLDEYPAALVEVRRAAESGDANALQHAAHSLKGSIANFGAKTAYDAALRLEKMGRSGEFESTAEALLALDEALDRLKPELRRLISG